MIKKTEIIYPKEWFVNSVIEYASISTCKRSKCGSLIVSNDSIIIGRGYNSMPCDKDTACFKDTLAPTFKSDKNCCVHAEQRAIMDALKDRHSRYLKGSDLYFIRLDENDKPIHAGKPYCTICSKMALDVGIKRFILWHEEGWTAYETEYYNELSFQYK